MSDFWERPQVSNKVWDKSSDYFRQVEAAFSEYFDWMNRLIESGIPLVEHENVFFPGDISATLTCDDDISVGLVGLNSSFLQVGGGDYQRRVGLDVRQLLPVTNDPAKWCSKHKNQLSCDASPSELVKRSDSLRGTHLSA